MKALMRKPPGSLPRTWTMHLIWSTPSISSFPTDQSPCSRTNLFLTHLIYSILFSLTYKRSICYQTPHIYKKDSYLLHLFLFLLCFLLLVTKTHRAFLPQYLPLIIVSP